MDERKRILIVDDERSILFVLTAALRRLGDEYEVVSAQSGTEALEQVRAGPLALVITDIRMKPMDGVALTRAIREVDADVPVVWMTAYGYDDLHDQAEDLSVYASLNKPLEVSRFRQVVQEAIAGSDHGSAHEAGAG